MYRIIFTGAQGTGKTTILKEFERHGCEVITEVVRKLMKEGVKINKDGDEEGQDIIFNTYKKLFNNPDNPSFISDRGLLDVTAYSMYLYKRGKISEEFMQKQFKDLEQFHKKNLGIIYCFFPIEFPLEDDGVRDMDEEFRKEIQDNIQELIKRLGIRPVVVKGSVEERILKVDDVFNWLSLSLELFS